MGRHWTNYERAEFRKMWADGASYPQIAERLHRTLATLKTMRMMMGLPTRRGGRVPAWSDDQNAALIRMWEDGKSTKVIARAVGKNPGAVAMQRGRLGLPVRFHRTDRTLISFTLPDTTAARLAQMAEAVGLTRTEYLVRLIDNAHQ